MILAVDMDEFRHQLTYIEKEIDVFESVLDELNAYVRRLG